MQRRTFIAGSISASLTIATASTPSLSISVAPKNEKRYQNGRSPWPICLDTATIRPAGGLEKKVEIAHKAGYDAIEPWDNELQEYEKSGGNLKKLVEKIKNLDMFVPSMIGLWGCLQPNPELFEKSLNETRNRMRMASEIGCQYVQAIPNEIGENFDYKFAAESYRRLIEIGKKEFNSNIFPVPDIGNPSCIWNCLHNTHLFFIDDLAS